MGTTGRFGKSNGLFKGHTNCTFIFLLLSLVLPLQVLPLTDVLFSFLAAYENTDYSELFVGFMFVFGFFLATVLLLCLCLLVFWLKKQFCYDRQAIRTAHRVHNVPFGSGLSTRRANMSY